MDFGRKPDTVLELMDEGRLSRRSLLKRSAALGLAIPVMSGLIAACGNDDDDPPADDAEPTTSANDVPTDDMPDGDEETPATGEGRFGGRLRVALIGEPPTLDVHQTTAVIVTQIVWTMYEALFTWDQDFAPIPQLAESFTASDDGLTNTIKLREGVLFHNGEEMLAQDVIASFERWSQISNPGKSIREAIDEVVEIDDYTIDFKMKRPLGTFLVLLARQAQGLAIYPKSVIDAAGADPLTEFIGTGPYKFTDRQADSYILVSRFEDYVGIDGEPNGYGGGKAAYLDEIEFVPVPDEAARIAGMQAGDYHFVVNLTPDQLETFEGDSNVVVGTLPPDGYNVLVLNTAHGIMTDQRIRQAFQAALDCEPIAQAAQGEGYFRLDPGFMLKETIWHSTVHEELYSQGNPEKARQLLEEAGYDGTPLRFLTSQEYQDQYNTAVVARQQLEDVGFVIELVVTDWATLIENRSDEKNWDVFTTWLGFAPDPLTMSPVAACTWPGWWCTDEKVDAVERLLNETDFDTRFSALEDLQTLFYTEAPIVKIADRTSIFARSPKLIGIEKFPHQLQAEFANVWLEE